MKLLHRIDKDGMFVEDVLVSDDVTPTDVLIGEQPVGFYNPKWNGTKWVEGMPSDELDGIKESSIRLQKVEEARKYLSDTDWYVIRFTERGEAVPKDVADARLEAVATISGGTK